MTVIAITKFRPHSRKANLVLQNMKDVVSEFDKMGMTARISSKGTERCRTGRPSSRLAVYSCIEYGSEGSTFFNKDLIFLKTKLLHLIIAKSQSNQPF